MTDEWGFMIVGDWVWIGIDDGVKRPLVRLPDDLVEHYPHGTMFGPEQR